MGEGVYGYGPPGPGSSLYIRCRPLQTCLDRCFFIFVFRHERNATRSRIRILESPLLGRRCVTRLEPDGTRHGRRFAILRAPSGLFGKKSLRPSRIGPVWVGHCSTSFARTMWASWLIAMTSLFNTMAAHSGVRLRTSEPRMSGDESIANVENWLRYSASVCPPLHTCNSI